MLVDVRYFLRADHAKDNFDSMFQIKLNQFLSNNYIY